MAWSTEFESGLLDDFDFTIRRAFYAPNAKYKDGTVTLLNWEGTTDSDDPKYHDYNMWFPVGKGFTSPDGGKTIRHESGRDKYFVDSSLIAKLIARCVHDFGIGDLLEERGTPFEAKVWPGLVFHMKSEKFEYGAGLEPTTRVFPNRFVGVVEVGANTGKTGSTGGASSNAADKIAAARARAAGNASVESNPLRDKVESIFRGAPTFEAAQEEALALDGVTDDDDLLNDVMEESGLWARVRS